jgi:hypothetical protein
MYIMTVIEFMFVLCVGIITLALATIKENKKMVGEIQNFTYDESISFESNYQTWYDLANRERRDWLEDPLSDEEAYDQFIGRYGQYKVTS